ncbi:MAG: alpha-amylase family glycosyl hydrolase, partial [Bacteroidota bacterium]
VTADSDTLFHWFNNETPPDAPLQADVMSSFSEIYEQGFVSFSDLSAGQIDSWSWSFEGGDPATSTASNPKVRYDHAGTYKVSLTVTRGDQSSTVTRNNFVEVLKRETEAIPWWNETVFYEIFVRSFKDSDGDGVGDFQGIIEQLDYLNDGDPNTTDDLGITGIWLMPIHEAGSYHGYDVIDYKSVSSDYGTMEDFKAFLDAAHARGIKVIIDFVINHNSSQSEWFQNARTGPDAEYRNYYIWEDTNPGYNGPWGQEVWHRSNNDFYYGLFWDGMPDLNFNEPRVKEEIFSAADFWLEEIGLDGFRLDAVKFLLEEGQQLEDTPGTLNFWKDFTSHIQSINPEAFSVGEAWTNTEKVRDYVIDDRIDYCFEFDLAGAMLNAVNNQNAIQLFDQMQKMYSIYPHLQYGTFLTNHDQNRVMNVLGNQIDRAKIAANLLLTLPGVPYLYYGEEVGMLGAKPDEFIRTPMQWNDERSAGFSTGFPWINPGVNYTTNNVASLTDNENSLLSNYRNMIHLRNREKALQIGTYEGLRSNDNRIFAFLRRHEQDLFLVIHNLGSSSVNLNQLTAEGIGLGDLQTSLLASWELTDAMTGAFAGSAASNLESIEIELRMEPRSTRVLQLTQVNSSSAFKINQSINVFPNPSKDRLQIELPTNWQGIRQYRIFDIAGKVVAQGTMDTGNTRHALAVNMLENGLYTLQLIGAQNAGSVRFIKN